MKPSSTVDGVRLLVVVGCSEALAEEAFPVLQRSTTNEELDGRKLVGGLETRVQSTILHHPERD